MHFGGGYAVACGLVPDVKPARKGDRTPLSIYAEIEARRFSRTELREFLSIGFPRMAAFAAEMSRGTVAGIVPQDPAMDLVARFYVLLNEREKNRWDAYFIADGSMKCRAKSVALSVQGLYDWKDSTMEDLGRAFAVSFQRNTVDALEAHGQ